MRGMVSHGNRKSSSFVLMHIFLEVLGHFSRLPCCNCGTTQSEYPPAKIAKILLFVRCRPEKHVLSECSDLWPGWVGLSSLTGVHGWGGPQRGRIVSMEHLPFEWVPYLLNKLKQTIASRGLPYLWTPPCQCDRRFEWVSRGSRT